MKAEQPQTPDDIELVPDAWDRFKQAVRVIARHKPRNEKAPEPPKRPRRESVEQS